MARAGAYRLGKTRDSKYRSLSVGKRIGRKATRDKRSQRAIGKKRESAACFPRRDQRLHPNGGKGRLFIDLTAGRSGKSARCGYAAEALSEPL